MLLSGLLIKLLRLRKNIIVKIIVMLHSVFQLKELLKLFKLAVGFGKKAHNPSFASYNKQKKEAKEGFF